MFTEDGIGKLFDDKSYAPPPLPDLTLADLTTPAMSEAIAGMTLPLRIGLLGDGRPLAADLATLPHLLIAGKPGSGKSTALHGMLRSLVDSYAAREWLLLVDPKRFELARYGDSPAVARLTADGSPCILHDPNMIACLIADLAGAIDARYTMMQEQGLRDWGDVEARDKTAKRWVLVVDELSEHLDYSSNRNRLAKILRLGRAAGVHVIATTYPTSRAFSDAVRIHVPARMCLTVESAKHSVMAIGTSGAESLPGPGHALIKLPGQTATARIRLARVE